MRLDFEQKTIHSLISSHPTKLKPSDLHGSGMWCSVVVAAKVGVHRNKNETKGSDQELDPIYHRFALPLNSSESQNCCHPNCYLMDDKWFICIGLYHFHTPVKRGSKSVALITSKHVSHHKHPSRSWVEERLASILNVIFESPEYRHQTNQIN